MAKMTKTQKKNALKTIKSRATALFTASGSAVMSMKDYDAIIRITERIEKKL